MKDLIEALQIFLKYGNPAYPTICEHYTLYITDEIDPKEVSQEDIERLKKLVFIVTVDNSQFYSFKFGSA